MFNIINADNGRFSKASYSVPIQASVPVSSVLVIHRPIPNNYTCLDILNVMTGQ